MYTIMFVDHSSGIGYQLTRRNLIHAPPGRIRIGRFTTGFLPDHGLGYYSESYLRQFVRVWKHKTMVRKQRRLEKYTTCLCLTNLIPHDLIRTIAQYI
jgi:hypothetical protein